ncbi:hypothetical protein ACN28G_29635 [Micromonospora sp. WMMA1923]|uniref:hypothetical protein n=1 Tax=Micromonospora sp. WMMA1923 TaxID=3404125 RepID=UPI003B9363E3
MTRLDEAAGPVDRFDAARLTLQAHRNTGGCLHCRPEGCEQLRWAVEELSQHPGGRPLLAQARIPLSGTHPCSSEEGRSW